MFLYFLLKSWLSVYEVYERKEMFLIIWTIQKNSKC